MNKLDLMNNKFKPFLCWISFKMDARSWYGHAFQ